MSMYANAKQKKKKKKMMIITCAKSVREIGARNRVRVRERLQVFPIARGGER